jgi:hypothetical protein
MAADNCSVANGRATACLVIHAVPGAVSSRHGLDSVIERLRAFFRARNRTGESLSFTVQIDDLGGRRIVDIHDAVPLVHVLLPAGTYNVIARRGGIQRAYTIALDCGSTFDLYPRFDVLRSNGSI